MLPVLSEKIPHAGESVFAALALIGGLATGATLHEAVSGLMALATVFSALAAIVLRVVPAARKSQKKKGLGARLESEKTTQKPI